MRGVIEFWRVKVQYHQVVKIPSPRALEGRGFVCSNFGATYCNYAHYCDLYTGLPSLNPTCNPLKAAQHPSLKTIQCAMKAPTLWAHQAQPGP